MTYRNDRGYLEFKTKVKGKKVNLVSKAIDYAIAADGSHLEDQPAVSESQNVFKSLGD